MGEIGSWVFWQTCKGSKTTSKALCDVQTTKTINLQKFKNENIFITLNKGNEINY
jgi:hypothetical protein